MIDEYIQNIVYEDVNKGYIIKEYLEVLKSKLDHVEIKSQFNNLRLFGGVLEAFVVTANIFEIPDLTQKFMNSLFNSIMITHLAFYSGKISKLLQFPTGGNLLFLIDLFCEQKPNLIELKEEDIKWIDVTVSGYWIMNLSLPNKNEIIKKWKGYEYVNTETKLFNDFNSILNIQEYNLLHVFYLYKKADCELAKRWKYKEWIDNALKEYDLMKMEEVQYIIDMMAEVFTCLIFEDMFKYLFEQLSKNHPNKSVEGNTYIHSLYNKYIANKEI